MIRTGLTTNTTRWTLPVFSNTQAGATRRVAVCRQFNCGPDAVSSVVIPPDACPQPQYDGWMTVIDNTTHTALDFWRARCEADGSLSYHYVKRWDLDGPGFQQPNQPSARGSGLPLFAGLITPDEVRSGEINHALAISVPGAATRRYVQPASRTDGTGLVDSLPEGARIRLKKSVAKKLLKREQAPPHNHKRTQQCEPPPQPQPRTQQCEPPPQPFGSPAPEPRLRPQQGRGALRAHDHHGVTPLWRDRR